MTNTLAPILKAERTARALSVVKMAALIGVSVRALRNYEDQENNQFAEGNLIKIAKFFDWDVDEVFCRVGRLSPAIRERIMKDPMLIKNIKLFNEWRGV